jgi:outer membrane protein TolC
VTPANGKAPDHPITVDEAVRLALALQPTLDESRANVRAAQGRTEQVRSGLLPHISFTGAFNDYFVLATNGHATNLPSGTVYGATATLSQLLFDFNNTLNQVRQYRALERSAGYGLTQAENDLAAQVKTAFYLYQQNVDLVRVNEENVANTQQQVDLANARFKTGIGEPQDVVTGVTVHDAAVAALTTAQADRETARAALAEMIGFDPQIPLQVATTSERSFDYSNLPKLQQTALASRPEILQAQENLRSDEFALSAAKVTNLPSISGVAGINSTDSTFPPGNDAGYVGVNISVTPFDGGFTAGKVKSAKATVDAANAALRSEQLTVKGDVAQAYINLQAAERNAATLLANVDNAKEAVRQAVGRYRNGIGQYLDIITAQGLLYTAEQNLAGAQYGVNAARVALRHAIGESAAAPGPAMMRK